MSLIKKIKKINPFLQSPILFFDSQYKFSACLLYRNTDNEFLKNFITEVLSIGFLIDLQKKKLLQNFVFRQRDLAINLSGNVLFLYSKNLTISHLLILQKILENYDVKLFFANYKNFFINSSRLNFLTDSSFLPKIYFSFVKALLSISYSLFKTIRLFYFVVSLHLYRLGLFLNSKLYVAKHVK